MSICLRHVDANTLEVHEEFVGLHETDKTTSEILTTIIKDVVFRLGLNLYNCRGQGYDGASNMSGRLSGVQARISAEYPKALYIHCFCHSLILTVQDCSRSITLIRNTLDTIQELSNLIKFSPKRKALLERIRGNLDVGGVSLRPLCPTRWTVKAKSFESVIHNYEALLDMLQSIITGSDGVTNFEVTSRAGGIYSKMETFDLFLD